MRLIPREVWDHPASTANPPQRRWTPTAIDLVSPFDQFQLADDPPTSYLAPDPTPPYLTPDPPTPCLAPGTIVEECYEIGQPLGAGSMGEVYSARHIELGKSVAIKVITQRLSEDESAVNRFVIEAQILAQIQHPAIVAVEHLGEMPDGRAYFVMEHLHGESLAGRLSRDRVPYPEALHILDQMATALTVTHRHGVIHRDLKPGNTFLVYRTDEAPAVKLIDFGLATRAASDDYAEECEYFDSPGLGTPMYMSPEQACGMNLDHRTDIYSLGCIAYELVLGVRPFHQVHDLTAMRTAHLHVTPPRPRTVWPEIPPQLDRVLFAMLAKDPAHRPTLAQVRDILKRLCVSAPPPQQPETTLVKPSKRTTIGLAEAVVIVAAGALLGLTATWAILARNPDTQTQRPHPPTPMLTAPRLSG